MPLSKFKAVWVLVSSRIYWKEKRKLSEPEPQSLTDFCDVDSLELNRLNDRVTWREVEEAVKADEHDGKSCIIVSGSLHGPTRRLRCPLKNTAQVVLVPDTKKQHEIWLGQIRARITPWKLLKQRMKAHASKGETYEMEQLEIGEAITNNISAELTDPLALSKQLHKLDTLIELNSRGTEAVSATTTLVKVVADVEFVVEVAQRVADISKCVAGVSILFHVVALCARGVSRYAEVKRGRNVPPGTLARAIKVLSCVLKSTGEIIRPSSEVEPILEQFVFGVLKQTVDTMDDIEVFVLSGLGAQFWNVRFVKNAEATMELLEMKAVLVLHSGKTAMLERRTKHVPSKLPHHQRPQLSPFFVGGTKELGKLKEIVETRGSAVITQYGGAGKTELMIAETG